MKTNKARIVGTLAVMLIAFVLGVFIVFCAIPWHNYDRRKESLEAVLLDCKAKHCSFDEVRANLAAQDFEVSQNDDGSVTGVDSKTYKDVIFSAEVMIKLYLDEDGKLIGYELTDRVHGL